MLFRYSGRTLFLFFLVHCQLARKCMRQLQTQIKRVVAVILEHGLAEDDDDDSACPAEEDGDCTCEDDV